jgi:hypothetical protein
VFMFTFRVLITIHSDSGVGLYLSYLFRSLDPSTDVSSISQV